MLARLMETTDLVPNSIWWLVKGVLYKGEMAPSSTSVPEQKCPDFCPCSPLPESSQYDPGAFKGVASVLKPRVSEFVSN